MRLTAIGLLVLAGCSDGFEEGVKLGYKAGRIESLPCEGRVIHPEPNLSVTLACTQFSCRTAKECAALSAARKDTPQLTDFVPPATFAVYGDDTNAITGQEDRCLYPEDLASLGPHTIIGDNVIKANWLVGKICEGTVRYSP